MENITKAGTDFRAWFKHLIMPLELFLYGAAMSWVMVPHMLKRRQELERLFAVITSAAMMGLPLLPPDGELKLLPYFVPNLLYWRRMTAFSHELEGVDLRHIGH